MTAINNRHFLLSWFNLFLILWLCITADVWSENVSIVQTRTKLQRLDNEISQLKKNLSTVNDKRGALTLELAETEKQISEGIRQLRKTQTEMSSKQQKIKQLQQNLNDLNNQLATQQKLLADHVRTRYRTGEYQPIKWLIDQDEPYAISRLLTFYQYLIQSRQKIIDQIDSTRQSITSNQDSLKIELAEQQRLENDLNNHQKELERNKQHHELVIQSLNNEIQTKEHILEEFERNKTNLTRLLANLATQSMQTQATKPFTQMRRKLPNPVTGERKAFQRMNQGVTFFAVEGTPVTAVYPGKVVFSDWLNGYGLLLIIDHGQGFMTLYAHNQSLFKSKGSMVAQGEQIATVGHSGGLKQNGLYFEVRHRGKAIPALDWLS
ncbi:murein hydrolase activator EnvC family protein [Legionella jordanis]|uniref:Peptidase, M23/M37 family n=1 Tax=Legionella jordanis TaxID=456 RepID=A0A0W0VB57_9GAMM|nr:peptidoglycan DD-metalloendopeptidase family protein [Legionella jordanis]KTD17342.1 peptidase, M23/M37 family [Legionella jordanis]RMX01890.1 peptidase M24 [Legionella jordanis]RMX17680.1 peptidase M24 [Legionella jordanis]VEH11641.1 peptidase, M23/M37 family [Legionella jordanis]HAT8712981.1 peptidoglycan DD-metalloendopeptidase family protein [Legionella jordanis]